MERPCIQENGKQFVFKGEEKMREKIEMRDLQLDQKEKALTCLTLVSVIRVLLSANK